ncbi:MAG: sigma-70 family RNA polymerase sigma factor [Chitinophagales bacterium]
MRSKKYTLEEWLELIKSGNEEAISHLYEKYRKEFFLWIKNKYQCTDEQAMDAYQESVLVLYNNVKKEKLTKFTSSIKTYLFAIGRNVILYNRRKFQRERSSITDKESEIVDKTSVQVNLQVSERQKILIEVLNDMGSPCKDLIMLYYTENLQFKKIAEQMGYSSDTVARMQKMRCLKKMRAIMKETYSKEDLY